MEKENLQELSYYGTPLYSLLIYPVRNNAPLLCSGVRF